MTPNEITLLGIVYIIGFLFTMKKMTGEYWMNEEGHDLAISLFIVIAWWAMFIYYFVTEFIIREWD